MTNVLGAAMENYADVIARERQKIELLRKKIRECETRIASLTGSDSLDDLLEKELLAQQSPAAEQKASPQPARAPAVSELAAEETRERTKRLTDKWVRVLQYIGKEGKAFPQLSQFVAENGIGLTDGALRTGLMNLRKENGYVGNPRKGVYFVTDAALEAIEAKKRRDLTE